MCLALGFTQLGFYSIPATVESKHYYMLRRPVLKPGGEANEVGANTEAGTRAGRRTDRGGIDIEDGEDGEGSQRNRADLIDTELLAREQVARHGNGEALQGVLHQALDEVGNVDSHRRGGGGLGRGIGHLFILEEGENFRWLGNK